MPVSDEEKERIQRDIADRPGYIPVLLKDWLNWPDMASLEVNTPNLPGVIVEEGSSRVYPLADQAAHAVGYVGRPSQKEAAADAVLALPGMRIGRTGAEEADDLPLRGTPGFVQTETNVHGQVVRLVARNPGAPGKQVALGLDSGLQRLAVKSLGKEAGAAVVLDATNGEILAMASTPSFDPTLFDKGVPSATWKSWMTDPKHPLLNKATAGLFSPGSTFKPTVAMAALKCGALTPETVHYCPGYFKLGDHIFWCDGHIAHIMGLGVALGSDFPNTQIGQVPNHAWAQKHDIRWVPGDTVVQGIGQGYVSLTPLALATMIARIGSGNAITPHITRRIGGALQPLSLPNMAPKLDVNDAHLAVVRQGLFEVVNTPQGTAYASRLSLPDVQMAGKTGTAQTHNDTRAESAAGFNDMTIAWERRPNALFVAYAPVESPRYAVAVVIEHGNYGAQSAAPIAHDLMTYALLNDPAGRDVPLTNPPKMPPLTSPDAVNS